MAAERSKPCGYTVSSDRPGPEGYISDEKGSSEASCLFVFDGEGVQVYSTLTKSVPVRPKVSGAYISSALAGGTTNCPGVVARVT